VKRPPPATGITALLSDNPKSKVGKLLWSRLSAVSHVTFFGLQAGIRYRDVTTSLSPGVSAVPVGGNPSSVALQGACVLRALRKAATARFRLMGWEDGEWKAARDRAEQYEVELFQASGDVSQLSGEEARTSVRVHRSGRLRP
jgi:hypothetical protein